MQFFLYKSTLKTAGTLCSKIKDLNSNCAEYNINLYLGYLKTNIQTLLLSLCEGFLNDYLELSFDKVRKNWSQHLALTCLHILGCKMDRRGWAVGR